MTEGISMLMAVIAEIPPLSLVLVVEEPRPLRPDGEGGEVGQQRVEPPEPHLAHELKVAGKFNPFILFIYRFGKLEIIEVA